MQALIQIEGSILLWIQENLRGGIMNTLMRLFSQLGDVGAVWIAVTLVLLILKGTRRTGFYCAVSMVLTLIIVNACIKPLAARIRPYELIEGLTILVQPHADFSFPSGHSANSFSCAWILFRMLPGKRRVLPLILAGLIAFSRLVVGVHYPTDVIAGAAIGIAIAEGTLRFLPKLLKKYARN